MASSGKTLAIVGGGAAGLMAAVAAGDRAQAQGSSVGISIFERDDRVGRTILATGNGRCNFSNASIDSLRYRNGEFASQVLAALEALSAPSEEGVDAVHRQFRNLGLAWREEAEGRQYPAANKASVVLDVLRAATAGYGVREVCESEVAALDPPRAPGKPFTLRMRNGVLKRADAVVVAIGGRTLSVLDAPKLPRTATEPVLGPLAVAECDRLITRELDNIRVRVRVGLMRDGCEVPGARERGELMFRKYGVSGICVFNLSRFARKGDRLVMDFLDGRSSEEALAFLRERFGTLSQRYGALTYGDLLRGLLLPRVTDALVKSRFVNPHNHVMERDLPGLAELLRTFSLTVEGMADSSLSQVRRGGVEVQAVEADSLQVKQQPGLYVCGEALDVDGPCGGYNLHWAWASGLLAGMRAADALLGQSL